MKGYGRMGRGRVRERVRVRVRAWKERGEMLDLSVLGLVRVDDLSRDERIDDPIELHAFNRSGLSQRLAMREGRVKERLTVRARVGVRVRVRARVRVRVW